MYKKQTHTHILYIYIWSSPPATPLPTYIQRHIYPYLLHTYLPTCIHTYLHIDIHTYLHPFLPTYLLTYLPSYIHVHMHSYIHRYLRRYIHQYLPTCMHSFVHICLHACMHASIHTDRQTYIHTYTCAPLHHHIPHHKGGVCGEGGLERLGWTFFRSDGMKIVNIGIMMKPINWARFIANMRFPTAGVWRSLFSAPCNVANATDILKTKLQHNTPLFYGGQMVSW